MPSDGAVIVSASSSDAYGTYAVEFPAFFGASAWNDTETLYTSTYFVGTSDTDEGSFSSLTPRGF